MLGTPDENEFFNSFLGPDKVVLEWGSGWSTHYLANTCKEVYSIESSKEWYDLIKSVLPENGHIYFVPESKEPDDGFADGTLEEYRDYINYPKKLGLKFDLIFIDGRARVECAKVAKNLVKDDGLILIHDFDREEYHIVVKFLKPIAKAATLYAFRKR